MMNPDLSRLLSESGIIPLSVRSKTYLQVLVTEFTLARQAAGRRLELDIGEDLLSIDSPEQKLTFHRIVQQRVQKFGDAAREALERKLAEFDGASEILAYRFACPDWPLRYANGGVLPVVQMGGRSYFVLFYREVFPVGWNIANGGSDNREELLEPGRIALREFGEELLIVDHDQQNPMLYLFDPGEENRPSGYQVEAVEAWEQYIPNLDDYTRGAIPLKLVDGPDSVAVKFGQRESLTTGYFVNVTPHDNAIEVDRIALINVGGNACFLDGEFGAKGLLNQVVGLFDVEGMEGRLSADEVFPDRVYFSGIERIPKDIVQVRNEYLAHVKARGFRQPGNQYDDGPDEQKFRLCPIARTMIQRYYQWVASGSNSESGGGGPGPRPDPDCEVFLCHRSTNVEYARWLFQFLHQRGYRVFFSDETLAQCGESDYAAVINHALDRARVLIVLATHAEDLRSGWVEYEWKSFLNEILSDRKPEGQIFTLLGGVRIAELPFPLRSRQMVPFNPLSTQDSFECLRRFIGPPRGTAVG